jgi:predicted Zn finger-like uncharacterized protein
MKISCQSCATKYTIADDKVRGKTVKIKCKKCGATIVVGADGVEGGEAAGASPQASSGAPEWMVNVAEGDQRTLPADQIADLFRQGVITAETYVWRDGMAGWEPVSSVAEIQSLIGDVAAPPPAAPSPAAPSMDEMDDGLPTMMAQVPMGFRENAGPRPAAGAPAAGAPAARRNDKPKVDLFKPNVPDDDEDVATRVGSTAELLGDQGRPSGGVPAFSAGTAPAPAARRAPGPPAPTNPSPAPSYGGSASAEPAMAGAANSEASGIIDIKKLQGALNKPPAKPKEEKFDDLMNMGGGSPLFAQAPTFTAPDLSAPSPPSEPVAAAPTHLAAPLPAAAPPKSKTGLFAAIGVVALLAVGGIGFMMGGKKPAEPDATVKADTTKKDADKPAADKPGDKPADPAAAATTAAAATADPAAAAATADPVAAKDLTPEEKKRREEALKKKKADDDEKKKKADEDKKKAEEEEKKKKEDAAAAAAGSDKPFDRAAALSALGSAASSAASCKTADGPTGTGRISVTFATSGRVTSANVEGPPFAGTSVGGCIATKFRSARIPAFAGSDTKVGKTFTIN